MAQEKFTATPLTPRVGTKVEIDVETLVSGEAAQDLRELLSLRGALHFPGLFLTNEQQVQFAATMGTVSNEAPDGIFKISANPGLNPNSKLAGYQRASFTWHFDGYGRDTPYFASMLTTRGLSPSGGQTEVANCYAAYEDLTEDEKEYYATLRVVHNFETTMRTVEPWPSYEELREWQQQPTMTHPLIWTHTSGRKSLALGHSASHIEGMDLQEGRALLCRLCEWATQPQYVYSHEWQLGDLLIWDNTGTLHRVVPYPLDSGRMMHRTTLFGEEPLR